MNKNPPEWAAEGENLDDSKMILKGNHNVYGGWNKPLAFYICEYLEGKFITGSPTPESLCADPDNIWTD